MIFPIKTLISYISRFATLEQGAVISTGTPSGIGAIKVGDIVEIEIDGIGILKNVCGE
jgi:2-keto-4-pentenoate hydratase/2-oxohepta-3-ene-1,7-dioic acid hydratase in catechol pathway